MQIFRWDWKVAWMFCSARIGSPQVTVPTIGTLMTSLLARLNSSSKISIARGFVGSLRIYPFSSNDSRCAWTEEVDFKWTASQILAYGRWIPFFVKIAFLQIFQNFPLLISQFSIRHNISPFFWFKNCIYDSIEYKKMQTNVLLFCLNEKTLEKLWIFDRRWV